jgi:hypothetical protein
VGADDLDAHIGALDVGGAGRGALDPDEMARPNGSRGDAEHDGLGSGLAGGQRHRGHLCFLKVLMVYNTIQGSRNKFLLHYLGEFFSPKFSLISIYS